MTRCLTYLTRAGMKICLRSAKNTGCFLLWTTGEEKILLLESSEEKMTPQKYRKALTALKDAGIFSVINGILVGKPMDEVYQEEYQKLLTEVVGNPDLPILSNLNIGHGLPRCIIPFGVEATVDANGQKITFSRDIKLTAGKNDCETGTLQKETFWSVFL